MSGIASKDRSRGYLEPVPVAGRCSWGWLRRRLGDEDGCPFLAVVGKSCAYDGAGVYFLALDLAVGGEVLSRTK